MNRKNLSLLNPSDVVFAVLAFLALLVSPLARADYPGEILADAPLAYYRLNESVTTPTFDTATNRGSLGAAGNGLYLGATHGVSGAIVSQPADGAVGFPNAGSVSVPFQPVLNAAAPFSFEFWVKPNDTGNTRCVASSIVLGNSGWLFYNSLSAGQWTFRTIDSSSQNDNATGGTVVVGAWQHLAGVWDGTMNRLYVDGVAVASNTAATSFLPVSDTTVPLNIGVRSDNAFQFDGSVDEAAFYTNALSGAQILAHYRAGTNAAPVTPYNQVVFADGPAAYWRLDESAPSYAVAANSGSLGAAAKASYIGGVTNASGPSAPAFPGFGAANPCGRFDGTSGSVGSPLGLLNNRTQFTVMGWVRRGAVHSTRGGYFGQNDLLEFGDASGNSIEAWIDATGGNIIAGYPWADDQWGFIALTADGTTCTLYLDGAVAGTRVATVANYESNSFKFNIGGGGIFNPSGDFFNGDIDEVAVFDKSLTAGRISSLYLTASGSNAAPVMVNDPPTVSPAGTIYATTTFTLTADAAGALPMVGQWRRNGSAISGASSLTYTKANTTTGDSGNYDVIITNAYGAVTSQVVSVTVNTATPPTITNPPASRLVYAGGAASFSVGADGPAPFSYQWKHAGTNLPGATASSLVLSNCGAAQVGSYTVGVTNVAGGVLSSAATLTLIIPAAGSFQEAAVTNGPLAYWRLNESTGTTAYDYFGGYDGAVSGGVTIGNPGPSSPVFPGFESANTDYLFDGSSGNVQIGNPAGLNFSGQISVVAWVKPASMSGGIHDIFMHGYTTTPNGECGMRRNGSAYQFLAWDGNDHLVAADVQTSDIGNWVMLVGTYDGATWRLYHNGLLAGESANSTGALLVNAGWAIGSRGGNTADGRFWDGEIDEVAIYNKALSSDAITTMYAAGAFGSTTPPFVSINPASSTAVVGSTVTLNAGVLGSLPITYQWKKNGVNIPGATRQSLTLSNLFFADSGNYALYATNNVGHTNTTTAALTVAPQPTFANLTNGLMLHLKFEGNYNDSSGRANDASAPSGSPAFIAGKLGQAVNINTSPGQNYLVISDLAGDLTFDQTASFSVSLWLRYTAAFNDVPILGNAQNSTYNPGVVFTEEGGKLEWTAVSFGAGGSIIADPVPGSPPINDGAWHHLAVAFDRTGGNAFSYVDGALVDSRSIGSLGSLANGLNFTIGQDPTGVYGTANFDLDDVGIWRRALSGYEVASIYGAAQNSGESFDVYGPIKVYIQASGPALYIAWQAGTLLESTNVSGPYTPVIGAAAPYYVTAPSAVRKFYRVQQ